MKKTFEHFLNQVKTGKINEYHDIYSFTPSSTFTFLKPAEAKTKDGLVSVIPGIEYRVIDTDDVWVRTVQLPDGNEIIFDVDTIFDNIAITEPTDENAESFIKRHTKNKPKKGDKIEITKGKYKGKEAKITSVHSTYDAGEVNVYTVKTDDGTSVSLPSKDYFKVNEQNDSILITKLSDFKEKKTITANAKPKKGKMHQELGIPEDKEISDVYTSGKKLAEDLVKKVGKKKATGMLAFAANIHKGKDLFDTALKAVHLIEESVTNEVMLPSVKLNGGKNNLSPVYIVRNSEAANFSDDHNVIAIYNEDIPQLLEFLNKYVTN
jgi:ribosomal protein L24